MIFFMQIQKHGPHDFKSSLVYVWCISIKFHHYANIFIQIGNLDPSKKLSH